MFDLIGTQKRRSCNEIGVDPVTSSGTSGGSSGGPSGMFIKRGINQSEYNAHYFFLFI